MFDYFALESFPQWPIISVGAKSIFSSLKSSFLNWVTPQLNNGGKNKRTNKLTELKITDIKNDLNKCCLYRETIDIGDFTKL